MKSYLPLKPYRFTSMGYLVKDARGRSPFWQAVYFGTDGRKVRKSTKCTDKRQARLVLQGFEAAQLLASAPSVTEEQIRRVMSETIARVNGPRRTTRPRPGRARLRLSLST